MDKPEALRLADAIDPFVRPYAPDHLTSKVVAAELRRLSAVEAQRDALLEAMKRIESAVDWYLGRSSFTQTTQLKGLEHSASVRKELFAAHDKARAAIKAVEENT